MSAAPMETSTVPANPYKPPRAYRPGTRKLRVLLISHTCQSRTEGQPKAHELAKLPDIDLHLLTPRRWKHYGAWREAEPPLNAKFQTTIAPVRFAWVGPAQYFLHYYPSLPKVLQAFKPDIIDLWEEPWGHVSANACALRNRLLPSAKIISETEQNIFKNLPFPFERFRTFTLQQADFAVGRNVESIEIIRRKGYKGPAEVVPNAVDTELFRPMDRAACREKIAVEIWPGESVESRAVKIENVFLAGYLGRLVEEKGLLDMVNALPAAPARVHLLFVGAGPLEGALRARAGELQVAARVHILPARPLEQLPGIMNAIDVLVLPSRTIARWKEQFGRVIIEAHACGTPVIGSDSGAIPEVVADAGLVFPEGDAAKLAAALATVAQNPTLARELGAKGLENARTLFTWKTVAERMATIFQQATGTLPA